MNFFPTCHMLALRPLNENSTAKDLVGKLFTVWKIAISFIKPYWTIIRT